MAIVKGGSDATTHGIIYTQFEEKNTATYWFKSSFFFSYDSKVQKTCDSIYFFPLRMQFLTFFIDGCHIRSDWSLTWFNLVLLNFCPLNDFISFFVTNKLHVWCLQFKTMNKSGFMAKANRLICTWYMMLNWFHQADCFRLNNKNAITLFSCAFALATACSIFRDKTCIWCDRLATTAIKMHGL